MLICDYLPKSRLLLFNKSFSGSEPAFYFGSHYDWPNICNFAGIRNITMKNITRLLPVIAALLLWGCNGNEELRIAEVARAEKYNDSILKVISANWHFDVPPPTPGVAQRIQGWNEWQQFRAELAQKPVGTIGGFKQKTKNLVNKADQLTNNIPPFFNKPAVLSRIGVLATKTKMLYTYLNLEVPQDKKVVALIGDITRESISMQNQLDELVRRSEIPKEVGEEEMLKALDTARLANPDAIPQPEDAPQANPMKYNRRHPLDTPPSKKTNPQNLRIQ